MKSPFRPRKFGIDVNLTPLIDVVFNLVIFFLVASHFSSSEAVEEVNLPRASQTADDAEIPRRLLVTVQTDGKYFVSGREVSVEELEFLMKDGAGDDPAGYAVHIRGDRKTPYQHIEKILMLCPPQGISNVGFKVLPVEAE